MELVYIISSIGMILAAPAIVWLVIDTIRGFKNLNKGLDRIEERLEERKNLINKL